MCLTNIILFQRALELENENAVTEKTWQKLMERSPSCLKRSGLKNAK